MMSAPAPTSTPASTSASSSTPSTNTNAPALPKPIILKVVLLGNAGVGKTSLLNRCIDNTTFTNQYKATIGTDMRSKEMMIGDQPVVLQIWDTAGQERFNSLGEMFYRGANICMLVFDLTKPESFEALPLWKDEFLANAKHDDTFPFACLANKCDIIKQRAVSQKRAINWCNSDGMNIQYFETSAKDATNVSQAFRTMATYALKQIQSHPPPTPRFDSRLDISQTRTRNQNNTSCC